MSGVVLRIRANCLSCSEAEAAEMLGFSDSSRVVLRISEALSDAQAAVAIQKKSCSEVLRQTRRAPPFL